MPWLDVTRRLVNGLMITPCRKTKKMQKWHKDFQADIYFKNQYTKSKKPTLPFADSSRTWCHRRIPIGAYQNKRRINISDLKTLNKWVKIQISVHLICNMLHHWQPWELAHKQNVLKMVQFSFFGFKKCRIILYPLLEGVTFTTTVPNYNFKKLEVWIFSF